MTTIASLSTLNQSILKIPKAKFISAKEHERIQQVVDQALISNIPGTMKIHKRDVGLSHSIVILEDKTPVLLISKKESVIGKGGNSVVTWGLHLTTGKVVAVSRIGLNANQPIVQTQLDKINQIRERVFNPTLESLRTCQGEGIVSLQGACASKNRDGVIQQKLILEYCEKGDLLHVMQKLSIDEKKQVVSDVLRAVEHMHKQGIAHGDLKPENILISQDMRAKVTDFDCAAPLGQDIGFATVQHCPPETFSTPPNTSANIKRDAWALGITFFRMLAPKEERLAFLSSLFPTGAAMAPNVSQEILDAFIERAIPKEFHSLLKGLLQVDPEARSSVEGARMAWDRVFQARATP